MLLNTPLDAEEAKAIGADEIIVATGSLPDGKAFQRAMPEHDALPGIERGNVGQRRGRDGAAPPGPASASSCSTKPPTGRVRAPR